MSLAAQSLVIISTVVAFKTLSTYAAEPTVIFLGPNGVRPVDGSSSSSNNGMVQQQSISNRDEGSSGSKFDLYSISAAIKEKLQERQSKKSGPRIIVIPQQQQSQTSNVQRSTYNPQTSFSSGQFASSYSPSFSNYGQGYSYGSSSPYGGANSYSPYAAASTYSNTYAYPSSYPSYSSYPSSYPSYSAQSSFANPSYSQPQSSGGGSYGSPYAAASTPYATYAYPSSSSLSNYFTSLNPLSSLISRINPFLMYPQLAALTQSLYNY